MSTAELKSNLHKLIDSLDDKSVLSKVYTFLAALTGKNKVDEDYYDLPIEVRKAIEEGIEQLDNGKGISYEEFRKEIKSKYNL